MKPENHSPFSNALLDGQAAKPGNEKAAASEPLWDSLREGEVNALGQIFRQYYRTLFNYGMRLNHDQEEVKDCIQTLFLNIWERKEHLGESDSIRNYLLASLRRMIIKRMNVSKDTFVSIGDEEISFHADLSVEAKMIRDQLTFEKISLLQAAISRLPDRQREALFLRFYSDQSFADIARVMNISTRAVYKLIYKALDSLNEDLRPYAKSIPFLLLLFFSLPFEPVAGLWQQMQ